MQRPLAKPPCVLLKSEFGFLVAWFAFLCSYGRLASVYQVQAMRGDKVDFNLRQLVLLALRLCCSLGLLLQPPKSLGAVLGVLL